MSSRIWRECLLLVAVLQMLHLPLPCPDLDGECRGTPILSLADANAWHLLISGVKPNDDIDRGPFHPNSSKERSPLSDSPYGDLAITNGLTNSTLQSDAVLLDFLVLHFDAALLGIEDVDPSFVLHSRTPQTRRLSDARTLRALSCVWRI